MPHAKRPPDLHDHLRDGLRSLAEHAHTHAGNIPEEQLRELERLARLLELQGKAAPPPRRRWVPALLLGGTLGLLSLLLFVRVPATDIELEASVSALAFTLRTEQVLLEQQPLASVGISAAEVVRTPEPFAGVRTPVRVSAPAPGSVTLAPLVLPAGTRVWLEGADGGTWRLALEGSLPNLRLDVLGAVRVDGPGAPPPQTVPSPESFVFRPQRNAADLTLSSSHPLLLPQLDICGLRLFRVDEFSENGRTVVRPTSTLLSGSLFFSALDGREKKLRAGEALEFEQLCGILRPAKLGPEAASLSLRARTGELWTGSGEGRRSLMPVLLEWLQARHGLVLLWGGTLYLFGLATAILRWFGVRM